MLFSRPFSFVNAQVVGPDGVIASALRVERSRVAGFAPRPREAQFDVNGAFIYPGLGNAHDHLELNNFPRLKWRPRHANARDWIADFQPRFNTDPGLAGPMSAPLDDRLFVGGLKNLLSGVTTVCHHNPLYPSLRRANFPVRVIRRYGWSHSLAIDGDSAAHAYRRTPKTWPWIIHAAEGTDAEAERELEQLERLGCLGSNTIIVHGVGLRLADRGKLVECGGGLVWCPSSNLFTLGATAEVRDLAGAGRVALGSDSRLSGERDLLHELKCAAQTGQVDAQALFRMTTSDAAALLRLPQAGRIAMGRPADLLLLPRRGDDPYQTLVNAERKDVELVVLNGQPRLGALAFAPLFAALRTETRRVEVDGAIKWLEQRLAQRLAAGSIGEPGVRF